ncbi:MAG: hypothetical protein HS111_15050 [Kofleriaceae bacterium]|nr:hypothetical protein [Kofleriaceae bacterium]
MSAAGPEVAGAAPAPGTEPSGASSGGRAMLVASSRSPSSLGTSRTPEGSSEKA